MISVFDLFKIGIGPSSSHTVGPMVAAAAFAGDVAESAIVDEVASVTIHLYGSLAATGRGHGSDRALLLGLEGHKPDTVDIDAAAARLTVIRSTRRIQLDGRRPMPLDPDAQIVFHVRKTLPTHPNGMRFDALRGDGSTALSRVYYSVGGGFVVDEDGAPVPHRDPSAPPPLPFSSAAELLEQCRRTQLPVSGVMLANELRNREEPVIREGLLRLWRIMEDCASRGCEQEGTLPGGLNVRRRAPGLYRALARPEAQEDTLLAMEWATLVAVAVNEENAAGGRVVTAPTNGAAGIIPAVLDHYTRFVPENDLDGVIRFLLTAGAIGFLFKQNASISGAEVGCQGEVGAACSMAAAALCEVLGGSPAQVENAAEIGIEHNLGLTCDPVGGLVQIPCIERNGMAAVQAINAARMALRGDGTHRVSLDAAIRTMRDTGRDMKSKYKETARGGLAINLTEC